MNANTNNTLVARWDDSTPEVSEGAVHQIVVTLPSVFLEAIAENLVETHPVRGLWKELRRGACGEGRPRPDQGT